MGKKNLKTIKSNAYAKHINIQTLIVIIGMKIPVPIKIQTGYYINLVFSDAAAMAG